MSPQKVRKLSLFIDERLPGFDSSFEGEIVDGCEVHFAPEKIPGVIRFP